MKVRFVAATTKIDNNGNKLSQAQLYDLANTAIGQKIGVNFNPFIPPVGKVVGAKVTKGKLIIEADIPENEFENYYLAPSYSIDKNTRIVKSLDYALTLEHSDAGATKGGKEHGRTQLG